MNNIISYDIEGYKIPYFSAVNTQGQQERLIEIGLHVLLVLIEYKPPTPENLKYLIDGGYTSLKKIYLHFKNEENAKAEEKTLEEDLTTNEFHRLLQVIHGKMNLEPFVDSMTKFFNNLIEPYTAYLPSSVTQIPFYQELLLLFWRFIQGNSYFLEETISHPEFLTKIYTTILFYFDSLKKDPTKCNLLYICVFILLTFSSNRDFSMGLNEAYNMSMQFDLKDFEGGTYADLTYQVIQRMIKAGPATLRPLYKSLVSVISNTAPYVKSLTKESAEGIFMLIKTFSDPDLLKKREETSRILSNLFEAVNYILLYNGEGNEEFLVALIKYREILKIKDAKLSEGEIQEVAQIKPTHAVKVDAPTHVETSKPVDEAKDEHSNEPDLTGNTEEPSVAQASTAEQTSEESSKVPSESSKEDSQDLSEVTQASEEPRPKEEEKAQPDDKMVDVPLDEIKHNETEENKDGQKTVTVKNHNTFLTPEWEAEWKSGLNLANIKQAIQYTDDKARSFLAKNPSPDNNIDADKFVEFLKKVGFSL